MTTLTGQRILLVEVWTNLVHKEVEEFTGYAVGGRSYKSSVSFTMRTNFETDTNVNNIWWSRTHMWNI